MNSKERVLAAVRWEEVDRLPVFAGVGATAKRTGQKRQPSDFLDSGAMVESRWQDWIEFEDDLIGVGSPLNLLGVFGAKLYWPEDGGQPMFKDPIITDWASVEALPIIDPADDPYFQAVLKAVPILKKRVGDEVLISSGVSGVFNLAGRMAGTYNLMRFVGKEPKLLHEFCRKLTIMLSSYARALVDVGVEFISMADALSSPACLSPKDYEEFALPYLTEVLQTAKKAGAIVSYHPCGGEYPIIDQVGKTGVDILYFSELVDLAVAQKIFVGRQAVAGTVDPSNVLFLETPEGVEQHVKGIIDRLKYRTGAIIMPGCALSPNVPIENIKAMVKSVKKYGVGTLAVEKTAS